MYRWATLLLLALVVALSGCGGAARDQHFQVNVGLETTRFTLPNGLDVILHPDRSFRDVAVSVRYDAGSRDDPPGASGLAHLVEHLTFRGKPNGRSERLQLRRVLRLLGHADGAVVVRRLAALAARSRSADRDGRRTVQHGGGALVEDADRNAAGASGA